MLVAITNSAKHVIAHIVPLPLLMLQTEQDIDWEHFFAPVAGTTKWLHATGITPLCGEVAAKVWVEHIKVARRNKVTVSIDLNHRPALASFSTLWSIAKEVVGIAHTLILVRVVIHPT